MVSVDGTEVGIMLGSIVGSIISAVVGALVKGKAGVGSPGSGKKVGAGAINPINRRKIERQGRGAWRETSE